MSTLVESLRRLFFKWKSDNGKIGADAEGWEDYRRGIFLYHSREGNLRGVKK